MVMCKQIYNKISKKELSSAVRGTVKHTSSLCYYVRSLLMECQDCPEDTFSSLRMCFVTIHIGSVFYPQIA